MPIKKKVIIPSESAKRIGDTAGKPPTDGRKKKKNKPKTKAKQVISKSKGQNIQIHIDLSKKSSKKTAPARPSPPAIYGMSAPTNSSSSMMDALNLITAQNLKYEQAQKNEVKSENVISGRKENVVPVSLGDKLNKSFVNPIWGSAPNRQSEEMEQSFGFQDEYPQEDDLFSENPELEEQYYSQLTKEEELSSSRGQPQFGTLLTTSSSSSLSSSLSPHQEVISKPSPVKRPPPPIPQRISTINYSRMKLPELQEVALEKGIDILKEDGQNPKGKGRGYRPTKNKQQLIEELSQL
jgi:hypothetical protein